MKLDIQDKWNLCYDVARFLVLEGGYQSQYAKMHNISKKIPHRIVKELIKEGIIRKLVRSANIAYGKGPNWHYCDDGIPPTPLYNGNFTYTINTNMRLHESNTKKVKVSYAPNPEHFSAKRGWKYTETPNIFNDTKTYSIRYLHENGKIIWNCSSKSPGTVQFRPVNERVYPVSSNNLTLGFQSVKNDYHNLIDFTVNTLGMQFDYPYWMMDDNELVTTIDVAFANVSDIVYDSIKSNGTIKHCLPEIGDVRGDCSKNARRKPHFEKGEWPEANYTVAKVYIDKLEKDEAIWDPFTNQYNIPSIGQTTHNARVGDKS
jgi:hypothetical protein